MFFFAKFTVLLLISVVLLKEIPHIDAQQIAICADNNGDRDECEALEKCDFCVKDSNCYLTGGEYIRNCV